MSETSNTPVPLKTTVFDNLELKGSDDYRLVVGTAPIHIRKLSGGDLSDGHVYLEPLEPKLPGAEALSVFFPEDDFDPLHTDEARKGEVPLLLLGQLYRIHWSPLPIVPEQLDPAEGQLVVGRTTIFVSPFLRLGKLSLRLYEFKRDWEERPNAYAIADDADYFGGEGPDWDGDEADDGAAAEGSGESGDGSLDEFIESEDPEVAKRELDEALERQEEAMADWWDRLEAEEEAKADLPKEDVPLASRPYSVTGARVVLHGVTGSDGAIEVEELPMGTYSVVVGGQSRHVNAVPKGPSEPQVLVFPPELERAPVDDERTDDDLLRTDGGSFVPLERVRAWAPGGDLPETMRPDTSAPSAEDRERPLTRRKEVQASGLARVEAELRAAEEAGDAGRVEALTRQREALRLHQQLATEQDPAKRQAIGQRLKELAPAEEEVK